MASGLPTASPRPNRLVQAVASLERGGALDVIAKQVGVAEYCDRLVQ